LLHASNSATAAPQNQLQLAECTCRKISLKICVVGCEVLRGVAPEVLTLSSFSNAPLSIFKIRNKGSRREIILILFTVVPKVTLVLWFHNFSKVYFVSLSLPPFIAFSVRKQERIKR